MKPRPKWVSKIVIIIFGSYCSYVEGKRKANLDDQADEFLCFEEIFGTFFTGEAPGTWQILDNETFLLVFLIYSLL